jgi:hypothetical protein
MINSSNNSNANFSLQKLRYLFLLITLTCLLFLYYASSSIYVKNTMFDFYKKINMQVVDNYVTLSNIQTTDSILIEKPTNTTTILSNLSTNNLSLEFDISKITNQHNNLTIFLTNSTLNSKIKLATNNSNELSNKTNLAVTLEECPLIPPNLGTRIEINKTEYNEEQIEQQSYIKNLNIELGGFWQPKTCKSRYRVAIVIPYRDRLKNLQLFLNHMHPFLSKQQLEYGIYLVEPVEGIIYFISRKIIIKN